MLLVPMSEDGGIVSEDVEGIRDTVEYPPLVPPRVGMSRFICCIVEASISQVRVIPFLLKQELGMDIETVSEIEVNSIERLRSLPNVNVPPISMFVRPAVIPEHDEVLEELFEELLEENKSLFILMQVDVILYVPGSMTPPQVLFARQASFVEPPSQPDAT